MLKQWFKYIKNIQTGNRILNFFVINRIFRQIDKRQISVNPPVMKYISFCKPIEIRQGK